MGNNTTNLAEKHLTDIYGENWSVAVMISDDLRSGVITLDDVVKAASGLDYADTLDVIKESVPAAAMEKAQVSSGKIVALWQDSASQSPAAQAEKKDKANRLASGDLSALGFDLSALSQAFQSGGNTDGADAANTMLAPLAGKAAESMSQMTGLSLLGLGIALGAQRAGSQLWSAVASVGAGE